MGHVSLGDQADVGRDGIQRRTEDLHHAVGVRQVNAWRADRLPEYATASSRMKSAPRCA